MSMLVTGDALAEVLVLVMSTVMSVLVIVLDRFRRCWCS